MSSIDELRRTQNPLLAPEKPDGGVDEGAGDLAIDPEVCSPEEVRAELRRVVESQRFDCSERNRRFLEYVVEETLSGRADRIKGYNIATTVFGRDVSFDPQFDPVVRMEARRLRRALERFYLTDGKNIGVKIEMPKGGYVPLFQNALSRKSLLERVGRKNPLGECALREFGTSILVTEFEAEGEQPFLSFNRGFARQLIIGLSRFPECFVFGPEAIVPRSTARDHEPLPTRDDVEFMLTGSTAVFGDYLNVKAMLVQPRTGRVFWGDCFGRDLRSGSIFAGRDDIANCIVRALAEPSGVMFRGSSPNAPNSDCVFDKPAH